MLNELFIKKEDINNYYIANVVFVTNGLNPSYEVIDCNKLVIKDKKLYSRYNAVYSMDSYQAFDGIFTVIPCWNTRYQIVDKLINYYPFFVSRRISDEEAKMLFENIPKIKILLEKGMGFEDIAELYTLKGKVKTKINITL